MSDECLILQFMSFSRGKSNKTQLSIGPLNAVWDEKASLIANAWVSMPLLYA